VRQLSNAGVTATDTVRFADVAVDETAFRAWYDASLPRVYGYLYSRCGGDRDVAEDLTQETFVEAVRARRYVDRGEPLAWLIGIARHKLVDHFRRLERRERRFLRLVASQPPQPLWMEGGGEKDRLAVALDRLPPAQRAAMVLRYMDDLPVRQVAQAMARTESAVESLLSRGRDALRRSLAEESR
jgi:RNA polymerase sigma-70 factor (ECF subfamily)